MLCSFTQIWAKSDDENLEILIDEAVKKVLNVMQWNQLDNVQMVYRDGTRSLDKDCDGTFADFNVKYQRKLTFMLMPWGQHECGADEGRMQFCLGLEVSIFLVNIIRKDS